MNATRYTIFETRWGYFGFVADGCAICRTCLPVPARGQARRILWYHGDDAVREDGLMADLQERIKAYFEGETVDFSTDPAVDLSGRSDFDRAVWAVCRRIAPGRKLTYGQLADKIGKPNAARAVGGAMARNPIPLIIPCHRVLCSDGSLGGFSAPGGIAVKRRMLEHERFVRRAEADLFAACPVPC